MKTKILFTTGIILLLLSCKKDFLDKKPNKSLTNPSTISDYWSLLDNRDVFQFTPALGQLASDDLYFTPATWATLSATERNSYVWAADIYQGANNAEWQLCYQQVYYSNCVLEGLENIGRNSSNQNDWNNVRGSALFLRAYAFYNLAEIFAKPYSSNASGDLGVPLRLSSDLSAKSVRANVEESYSRIISDLMEAKDLVPANLQINRTRPCKLAVTALLSRVYLSMGDFAKAEAYADSTLNNYGQLLDYNTVDQASTAPFNRADNPEVLYESHVYNYFSLLSRTNTLVDQALYASYDKDDLRKAIFFRVNSAGNFYFKGRYSRQAYLFSGMSTDETVLNRAECRARRGQADLALADLNRLLNNRWRKANGVSVFIPYANLSADAALDLVLAERRKELVFRAIRWTDLKRLNREPARQNTLSRLINGTEYTLLPNSNRYVFPIPQLEITLSGIPQNDR